MRDTVQTICVNPCNLWLTYSYRPFTLPPLERHTEEGIWRALQVPEIFVSSQNVA